MDPSALALALALFAAAPNDAGDAKGRAAHPRPPSEKEVRDAQKRGVAQLLEKQESLPVSGKKAAKSSGPEREWPYEGVYRVAGDIPIGYRIGGTAIVATSLIATSDGELAAPVRAAVERGLDFVLEALADPRMTAEFEKGYDVRGWGHAYALEFLLRLRSRKVVPAARAEEVERAIDDLVAILARSEIRERGGWNYTRPRGAQSDASTFMTAPTLQILFEARAQGEPVDAAVVERALKALEDARLASGAFQYGSDPADQKGTGFEAVAGAIGRMAVCEATLQLAGRGSAERLRGAVDAFFEHWEWLEKRRKQGGTHEPPYMIAPYYFFYAHRYAAQAIELLPEPEREERRARLRALLWQVRESGGGWNDRVFPRSESFGTAMALLALCEPGGPRPAAWATVATKQD